MADGCAAVARTQTILASVPDALSVLTVDEAQRAASFHRMQDRDDFIAAHLLVRFCIAAVLGGGLRDYVVAQVCERCGGPHGAPHVVAAPGLHISWAHSPGVVAAVAAGVSCGVDLERLDRPAPHATVMSEVLTRAELLTLKEGTKASDEFFKLWRRKEALVKAGVGSLSDLFDVDVSRTVDGVLGVMVGDEHRCFLVSERESHGAGVTVILEQPAGQIAWLDSVRAEWGDVRGVEP